MQQKINETFRKITNIKLFVLMFVVRVFMGFFIATYHSADQHYQGQEIAHRIVFNYGLFTWQWLGDHPIRNSFFVLPNMMYYLVLKYFSIDNTFLVSICGKVSQVFIGSLYDYFLIKTCIHLYPSDYFNSVPKFNKFYMLYTSWFMFVTMSRNYSNSLQALIVIIVYYNWLLYKKYQLIHYQIISRLFFVIGIIGRITILIIFAFVYPYQLVKEYIRHRNVTTALALVIKNVLTLVFGFGLTVLYDSITYGRLTSTQLNFIIFNIFQSKAVLYGYTPPYYFIILLPYLLTTNLIVLVFRFKSIVQDMNFQIFMWVAFILSLSKHNQQRFLLSSWCFLIFAMIPQFNRIKPFLKKIIRIITLVLYICLIVYMSRFHKRDNIDVMYSLQKYDVNKLLLLIECHETPLYSFIHKQLLLYRPIQIRFPECDPWSRQNPPTESDRMLQNQSVFLKDMLQEQSYVYDQNKWGQIKKYQDPYDYIVSQVQQIQGYEKVQSVGKWRIHRISNTKLQNNMYHSL